MLNETSAAGARDLSGDAPVPLVLDLLEWLARAPRTYAEAMDAWRTSCPRLTVWEDALDAGLVARQGAGVRLTDLGRACLARERP